MIELEKGYLELIRVDQPQKVEFKQDELQDIKKVIEKHQEEK